MDDLRLGAALRALRLRAGLRQSDVARLAGVSPSLVSSIEAGRLATVALGTLRRVFAAVGAGFEGLVRWRGPALERLLDARHAALVDASAARLRRLGWEVRPEVSYSEYGERGSIDILAGLEARRAMAVEEIKSDLVRLDDTIRKLDEKARLTREEVGRKRFGWQPASVGRILVLPDTDRARRQVGRHANVLTAAFADSPAAVRAWLRDPAGDLSGILFVAEISPDGRNTARPGMQRVRVRRTAVGRA